MKVKTYGVPGLTEWHGKLKAGSIEVAVSFVGGTASPSGAQPAYFMTKDPIVQLVIENSKEFKSGFISLSMQQEVPGEHPRMAIPKPKPAPTTEAPVTETPATPTIPAEETPAEAEQTGEAQDETSQDDGNGGDCNLVHLSEVALWKETDGKKVKVADKSEAIEYLKEHFADKNYTATSLRTKTAFDAACKECGVEFVFTA